MPLKKISIPYGKDTITFNVPEQQLIFDGSMQKTQALLDLKETVRIRLDAPIGCPPLKEMLKPGDRVLILIEDATRSTPVREILPVLVDYLQEAGIPLANIEVMTAPGTHRMMTQAEILDKVGPDMVAKLKISQHDYEDESVLITLDSIRIGDMTIPVQINRKISQVDFIIGIGNIIPHSDAGFSGGAKIMQPGICGYPTTAATHIAAAMLDEIPLGQVNNPCRQGMEEVARKAGLKFIINTIKNYNNEVIEIVAGDLVEAHREGARIAGAAFATRLPELADIVVVSSHPADMDFWQAGKGVTCAYFAVKPGGIIIFASPCYEGLAHNHPRFLEWLGMSYKDIIAAISSAPISDKSIDLISAVLAVCNSRAREKAHIHVVSDGLSPKEKEVLGFRSFDSVQEALEHALELKPDARIGVLPRGGDCLPVLE